LTWLYSSVYVLSYGVWLPKYLEFDKGSVERLFDEVRALCLDFRSEPIEVPGPYKGIMCVFSQDLPIDIDINRRRAGISIKILAGSKEEPHVVEVFIPDEEVDRVAVEAHGIRVDDLFYTTNNRFTTTTRIRWLELRQIGRNITIVLG